MDCKILIRLTIALLSLTCSPTLYACTLWSATGERVAEQGSLIAKNRDWLPDHYQELQLISHPGRLKYIGIFAIGGKAPGLKGGINAQGLVVVSATAGSIPSHERKTMRRTKHLLNKILSECGSVDEALTKNEWFLGPQHLLLADKHKIAVIEIAPNAQYSVKVMQNGVLYHTNHYLDGNLLKYNQKIGESSLIRLQRIAALLNSKSQPFTVEEFIAFSNDRDGGVNNSLWRTGKSKTGTRTLLSWIAILPPQGSPRVYVKMANPGEREKTYSFCPADIFSKKARLP
jgi:hypothetical protein